MRRTSLLLTLSLLLAGCGKTPRSRLIIVGLDAFNWHVLAPLLRDGRMPVLESIVRDGWWDVLLPERGPIVSPRLWTSIATGRTVNGHGIYDWQFYEKGRGKRSSGPADRTCAAFWNILSHEGLTVGVVDWMATWPPERVRGFMISRLLYPPGGNTYPSELELELWRLRGKPFDYDRLTPNDREDEWARLRNTVLLQAVSHLMKTRPVDVLAVFNYTPDPVQHKFWKYYEPREFPDEAWWAASERDDRLRNVVERHYVWSDTLLAECLSMAGPSTTVLIVSDHGQGPCGEPLIRATTEGMNRLLAALGYATVDSAGRAVRRQSIAWTEGVIGGRVGIVVNPSVQNSDAYVARLKDALGTLTFGRGGPPVFSFVGPCSDVGYDRLKGWAVDLCAVPAVEPHDYLSDRQVSVQGRAFSVKELVKLTADNSGCHRSEGIVALAGPLVRARGPIEGGPPVTGRTPKQVDVLPTLLYLLGLPLSRELEGRILWEALLPGLQAERPPAYVDAYPFAPPPLAHESSDARDLLRKKLHALGYVQ